MCEPIQKSRAYIRTQKGSLVINIERNNIYPRGITRISSEISTTAAEQQQQHHSTHTRRESTAKGEQITLSLCAELSTLHIISLVAPGIKSIEIAAIIIH